VSNEPTTEQQTDATSAKPQKAILRDYVETILICVIFVIFSRAFVFQQSKIPSGSMMDTLLIGDYIMVNRFVYAPHETALEKWFLPVRDIRRGDVVVFKYPPEPEIDYIKRVIGLPGDTVGLRQGFLFVNGEKVEEPYVKELYRERDINRNFGPVEVEPGHYFVMGDHRNASSDSRIWSQVPRALMKGRALLIWWSFDEEAETGGEAYPKAAARLKSWGYKARHFFTRSRWSRCFTVIR
jgi:signal peptidase I